MNAHIINRASWTNGIGIQVFGTWQVDEQGDPVFRVDGRDNDVFLSAPEIIGLESFRWENPIAIIRP
jgi:hypothetical protein